MKSRMTRIYESIRVSKNIRYDNLLSLDIGDKSHLGDAILEGLPIRHRGLVSINMDFSEDDIHYSIARPKVRIGSIEIDEPRKGLLPEGTRYYYPSIDDEHNLCRGLYWNGNREDRNLLACGLVHLDKKSAEQHARALIKLTS